jgi:hypothetical protein
MMKAQATSYAMPIAVTLTMELIGCAKDLCLALNLLVNKEQHNKPHGVRLRQFQLSTQEWDLLLQLYPLLDVCSSGSAEHMLLLISR